jgi:hypothetical protein
MSKVIFSKSNNYNSKPGFSGSGKILVADLLKAVCRTELYKWELSFDYFPILYSLNGIKKSAAFSTIKTIFDEITYNLVIGREINIKKSDFSSALAHPKRFSYLKSILEISKKTDNEITNKVAPNMYIPLIVHMSTFNNDFYEQVFPNKLKIIYTLRDPLFLIETYSSYIHRISEDPREFTVKIKYKNFDLPWFSLGWEEEYLKVNNTEKTIKLLKICFNLLSEKIISSKNKFYKLIFFEEIIKETDQIFHDMILFLDLEYSPKILKKLKIKNKIPRNNDNIVDGYWKRYTFGSVSREGEGTEELLQRTKSQVSEYYFKELQDLRKEYFKFKKLYSILDKT